MQIKPIGDRLLIEPIAKEELLGTSKSGIIIPDTAGKDRPEQGRIVALGEGKMLKDGKLVPFSYKIGQKVLFSKYGPTEVKVDGKELLIAKGEDILAIIED